MLCTSICPSLVVIDVALFVMLSSTMLLCIGWFFMGYGCSVWVCDEPSDIWDVSDVVHGTDVCGDTTLRVLAIAAEPCWLFSKKCRVVNHWRDRFHGE